MGLSYIPDQGQTPLDSEYLSGLRLVGVTTKLQLDELEQLNIQSAMNWLIRNPPKHDSLLEEKFIKSLHKRMFGDVWLWAGNFRRVDTNIGVDWWKIPSELKLLMDDAQFWLEHNTYPKEEWAIRIKHRLVSIHCFPNGNGRHSRLFADVLINNFANMPYFTWGAQASLDEYTTRANYLTSLRTADLGDYRPLIRFAMN